jgi:hypothetical protein
VTSPLQRIADLVLYLPLGLAMRAREELPKLAAEGRERFSLQAPVARMVGQMAVAQGRRKVEGMMERRPGAPEAGNPAPGVDVPVRDLTSEDASPPPASAAGPAPAAVDLPIPGYDSLSASQVVQRLPGLTVGELDAIRAYELAGRGRKTVLLRVAQLRAS